MLVHSQQPTHLDKPDKPSTQCAIFPKGINLLIRKHFLCLFCGGLGFFSSSILFKSLHYSQKMLSLKIVIDSFFIYWRYDLPQRQAFMNSEIMFQSWARFSGFCAPHIFLSFSAETAKKDKNWRNQQQDFSDLGKNFAECFNFDQISVVTWADLLLTSVGAGVSKGKAPQ